MLPSLRAACEEWQPDLILRDPAEYASAFAAEQRGIAHGRIAVGPASSESAMLSIAAPAIEDVLGDDAYRRAARRLADEMRALAPADGAVQALAVD